MFGSRRCALVGAGDQVEMPRVRGCVQTDQRHEAVSKIQNVSHRAGCATKRSPGRLSCCHPLGQSEDLVAISPIGSRKPSVRQPYGASWWSHDRLRFVPYNPQNRAVILRVA